MMTKPLRFSMWRLLVLGACAAAVAGCSMFGVRSGYEQASYVVVEPIGEAAEVRRYPPQLIAEASVAAADESSGRSAAFRALFDYISGANRAQAKLAMTTPVETARPPQTIAMTVPVETKVEPARPAAAPATLTYTMRFFLPAGLTLQTAPEPADPNVRIVEVPERTLAVLRFSGSTGPENVAQHLSELEAIVAASRWQAAGEPISMFYDPPWTLPMLRRNEVAVPVRLPPAG